MIIKTARVVNIYIKDVSGASVANTLMIFLSHVGKSTSCSTQNISSIVIRPSSMDILSTPGQVI